MRAISHKITKKAVKLAKEGNPRAESFNDLEF